jgi:hypothetical protein
MYNICDVSVFLPSSRACCVVNYFALIDRPIRVMAAGEPDICMCVEFSACDPVDPLSIDRHTFAHYVRHGPVQPTIGFRCQRYEN